MGADINRLLDNNRAWAKRMSEEDENFFLRLSTLQKPEYLWIGCSDSRVPANQITGLSPGEIFVHRNIANQVIHTDFNCWSVIQYAIEILSVRHIIVCGHYGCGGIQAALDNRSTGFVDSWLRHIQDICTLHQNEFNGLSSQACPDRLGELNTMYQVLQVGESALVRQAWKRNQYSRGSGCLASFPWGCGEIAIFSVRNLPDRANLRNAIFGVPVNGRM
jgi:carbonic anhydrase